MNFEFKKLCKALTYMCNFTNAGDILEPGTFQKGHQVPAPYNKYGLPNWSLVEYRFNQVN